jgi:hypothetical protein
MRMWAVERCIKPKTSIHKRFFKLNVKTLRICQIKCHNIKKKHRFMRTISCGGLYLIYIGLHFVVDDADHAADDFVDLVGWD